MKLLCFFALLMSCSSDVIVPFHDGLDKGILAKMKEYNIPGLSLAVVKDEKLVYAHSYGLAINESQTIVSNDHLFRVASISKVITAIAILKLADDEEISLDQTVFGTDGILADQYGTPAVDSKIDQITIRHLITHTSGWTNEPSDLVFAPSHLSQQTLITDLVSNRSLTYTPGSQYFYFNMGYVVLGRVIEKVTGKTYEEHVHDDILSASGITRMRIGGNTLAERFLDEVRYYNHNENVDAPYLLNLPRMDATAGWISSATDLARLVVRIDNKVSKPDIVPWQLLQQTYLGSDIWYHDGLMPGNSGFLARLNSSLSVVILTNSGHSTSIKDLYETVKNEVVEINGWPNHDLFE